MKLSIGFMTGRVEPRLDWLLEALQHQAHPEDVFELIVIDGRDRKTTLLTDREHAIIDRIPQLYGDIKVVAPKPNIWQGPHRVTSVDWWATANARNTFLALAKHDYIVSLDDCAKPCDTWLETIRRGELDRKSVIAGSYAKLEGPLDARTRADDHRRLQHPDGLPNCGGGWLYGCTFAMPLDWALVVNGFEEGCDSLTGEDYIFGLMLQNVGYRIDFDPKLFVLLDRAPFDVTMKGKFACKDKGVSPDDKSHAALHRFGKRSFTEFTPDLVELRERLARGRGFPVPDPALDYRDWYDGELVREMVP